MKKLWYGILLLTLVFFQRKMTVYLWEKVLFSHLPASAEEAEPFRQMRIDEETYLFLKKQSAKQQVDFYECLTTAMVLSDFSLTEPVNIEFSKLLTVRALLVEKRPETFYTLTRSYEKVLTDLTYFPLAIHAEQTEDPQFFYENSFGTPRTYGGKRVHEGIDLFGTKDLRECYPVISVTDGIVEKVGWLPLGGWRIGIRSPSGAYIYYAHLSSYTRTFQSGDTVHAGELLGLMGDTGYGPEGTTGKFPTHLHFGIYLPIEREEEMSVNPYYLLKLLEKKQQRYHY